jgi:hypothetical protein
MDVLTEVATIDGTSNTLTTLYGYPILRIQSGTTVTGINVANDGRIFILVNETANDVSILHESSLTTSTLRFNTPDGGRFLLRPKASVLVHYNAGIGRWLLTGYTSPPSTFSYKSVSTSYTLVASDYFVTGTGAVGLTLTLPTAVGFSGTVYYLKSRLTGSALLRIATTSSQTIDDVTSLTLARNEVIGVVSNGSNWEMF